MASPAEAIHLGEDFEQRYEAAAARMAELEERLVKVSERVSPDQIRQLFSAEAAYALCETASPAGVERQETVYEDYPRLTRDGSEARREGDNGRSR